MNDPQRLKIRRTAQTLHRVTLVVIGLVLVAGLILRTAEPAFIRGYFRKPLIRASGAVVDAFGQFHRERGNALTAFLPPANPDAMVAWAGKVQDYLGQPAAVFVREGTSATWINVPSELQEAVAEVPALFGADAGRRSLDTLGAFERRRERVEIDSVGYTVWIVGPLEDTLRWGAVVKFEDSWRPFFTLLREHSSAASRHPVVLPVKSAVQLDPPLGEETERTGLRAMLDTEELFRTPKLDTTHTVYPVRLSGHAQLEYYLSDEDEQAMRFFLAAGLSWLKILLLIAFGAVVHLFWRWVRALTAPLD